MKRLLIILFFLGLSNNAYSQDKTENGYDHMTTELNQLEKSVLNANNIRDILRAEEMVYAFYNNNVKSLPPAFVKRCYKLLIFLDSARAQIEHVKNLKEKGIIKALLDSPDLDKDAKLDDFIDSSLSCIFEKKIVTGRDILALEYITVLISSDLYKGIYNVPEFMEAAAMLETFMKTYVTNARIGHHDKTCKTSLDIALEHLRDRKKAIEAIRK